MCVGIGRIGPAYTSVEAHRVSVVQAPKREKKYLEAPTSVDKGGKPSQFGINQPNELFLEAFKHDIP